MPNSRNPSSKNKYHVWKYVLTIRYTIIGDPYVTSLGPDTSALLGWKSIMAKNNFTNEKYNFNFNGFSKSWREFKKKTFCLWRQILIQSSSIFLKVNSFFLKSKQAQFHNGRRANGLAEWFDAFDDVIKNTSSANQKRRLSGHCEKDAVEAVALFEDF